MNRHIKNIQDKEYEEWENDTLSENNNGLIYGCFENDFYYAETVIFNKYGNIRINKYKKSNICYELNKQRTKDQCSICLNNLQNIFQKKYITLECGHSLHKKCFDEYRKVKDELNEIITCPLCRFGVSCDDNIISKLKGLS